MNLLMLGVACSIPKPDVLLVERGRVRRGETIALIGDREGVLDLLLVPGAEKARAVDQISIEPNVPMEDVRTVVDWMIYAGSRAPVRAGGATLVANLFQPETCDIPVILVGGPRPMYTRILAAEKGFQEIEAMDSLEAMTTIRCGSLKPASQDCARGVVIAAPTSTWGEVAPQLGEQTWTLLTMPMGASCIE